MTIEEFNQLLFLAEDRRNWTSELFKSYQEACLRFTPCIFNLLRQKLSEKDYADFDFAYSMFGRPQDRKIIETLRKEVERERCRKEEVELLKRKRQLLRQSLQQLTKD